MRATTPRRAGGCSRTRWLDPILGRETVDQPGHIGLIGEVGQAPRPRAPAAAWPAHERPSGRVPGPCRLATGQEGRVARIVDDQGLIASASTGPSDSMPAAWTGLASGSVPSSGHGVMCRPADPSNRSGQSCQSRTRVSVSEPLVRRPRARVSEPSPWSRSSCTFLPGRTVGRAHRPNSGACATYCW